MTISFDPAEFEPIIEAAIARAIEADRRERRTEAAPAEEPLLVDSKEAARLLGVEPRTIADWRDRGLLSATKLGRLVRFHREELERAAKEGLAD